jgi:eukaryotic-like serine/threonine-protein kinase
LQTPLPGSLVTAVIPPLAHALGDRYVLEKELGRGGMATVYCARDLRHDRLVALKVLHPELAATLGPERFLREIRVTSGLQHPHILPVFDSGDAAGQLWYTMPYVRGESLRDRLRREVQLPMDTALDLTKQVADALGYAHRQGIVHRDVKPENILLEGDRAVVADFGIARALDLAGGERLTETGLALGTPRYMSPEQAMGSPVDARSDIYSLGCVLYEMLAGEPPFTGPTAQAIIAKRLSSSVPPLRTVRETVSPAVERAIEVALAKVPADRFATTEEFVAALYGAGPSDVKPSAAVRGIPRRWATIAAGTAIAVLAAALALQPWSRPAVHADIGLVAVVPFRIASSDSSLAFLREGMVDLFAAKLNGEAGPRSVDPRSTMRLWRATAEGRADLPEREVLRLARRLGAGRLLTGSVIGTSERLVLSAAVFDVATGKAQLQATVDGRYDSLPYLVDRLTGQLLGLGAAVQSQRLSSLTSTSLPAIRAYLAGQAAFRKWRLDEAVQRFNEATRLDSTFALAGMELAHAAGWLLSGGEEAQARGVRLAVAGRDRLGQADRALLEVSIGQWSGAPDMFQKWHAAAAAYPGRPEVWYGLGDSYFHWGQLAGMSDPLRRAGEAFRRGWQLDSAGVGDSLLPKQSPVFAEGLGHMVELAQIARDTAEVRRLVALGLAVDSTDRYLQWHLAVSLGDSARRAFWARPDLPDGVFSIIGMFTSWTGIAASDGVRARTEEVRRLRRKNPDLLGFVERGVAMNAGRPKEAYLHLDERHAPPRQVLQLHVLDALYWGGDTSAAVEAVRRLRPFVEAGSMRGGEARDQYNALCVVAQWRLARGETQGADLAIRRLRATTVPGLASADSAEFARDAALCAAIAEALQAAALHRPDVRRRTERLDSLARTFIFQSVSGVNLVLAHLWETQGDLPRALQAVRRRSTGYGLYPRLMSTFLREEGRLATLAGDREAAIRAYQHYLRLRPDPEPSVKPEVEQVRADLADLVGEHGQ